MPALWQNIIGIRMVALQTLMVTLTVLAAGNITHYISEDFVLAVAVTALFGLFLATVFTVLHRMAVFAAGFTVFAVLGVLAGFVVVIATAAVVAKEYKTKTIFCLGVFVVEAWLIFSAIMIWSMYVNLIIMAALTLGIVALIAEAKLRPGRIKHIINR